MKKIIEKIIEESIKVKKDSLSCNLDAIQETVVAITEAFQKGGKAIFFGNGGSAADSQHIAAEFIGRFQKERKSLPGIALTTDTSILTCLGNDYGFDIVFSRQIEGIAKENDVVVTFSTSGNSKNVLLGVEQAKKMGLKTISFTGCDGGKLAKLTDISIVIPSKVTARVQEAHICIAHAVCELVENSFVNN